MKELLDLIFARAFDISGLLLPVAWHFALSIASFLTVEVYLFLALRISLIDGETEGRSQEDRLWRVKECLRFLMETIVQVLLVSFMLYSIQQDILGSKALEVVLFCYYLLAALILVGFIHALIVKLRGR